MKKTSSRDQDEMKRDKMCWGGKERAAVWDTAPRSVYTVRLQAQKLNASSLRVGCQGYLCSKRPLQHLSVRRQRLDYYFLALRTSLVPQLPSSRHGFALPAFLSAVPDFLW